MTVKDFAWTTVAVCTAYMFVRAVYKSVKEDYQATKK